MLDERVHRVVGALAVVARDIDRDRVRDYLAANASVPGPRCPPVTAFTPLRFASAMVTAPDSIPPGVRPYSRAVADAVYALDFARAVADRSDILEIHRAMGVQRHHQIAHVVGGAQHAAGDAAHRVAVDQRAGRDIDVGRPSARRMSSSVTLYWRMRSRSSCTLIWRGRPPWMKVTDTPSTRRSVRARRWRWRRPVVEHIRRQRDGQDRYVVDVNRLDERLARAGRHAVDVARAVVQLDQRVFLVLADGELHASPRPRNPWPCRRCSTPFRPCKMASSGLRSAAEFLPATPRRNDDVRRRHHDLRIFSRGVLRSPCSRRAAHQNDENGQLAVDK